MKLGFIGTGKITSSVISGICSSKLNYKRIFISSRNNLIAKGLKNIKGNENENKLYYGKIKLNIKNWAQKNQNKEKILYMNDANKEHGGAGACYVYVRKKPTTA